MSHKTEEKKISSGQKSPAKAVIIKRIFKYLLLIVVVLPVITLAPILLYKKEINDIPLPSYYKKGVYHLHSTFSDGKGELAEITGAAASSNLDFVILTDHGRPNEACAQATGYYNDVLLIGGSEFSLNCGHLAAVGFKIPAYIFPPEPQEAIAEVNADEGVCFISHPYDRIAWTDWDIKDFTGIEILSAASCAGELDIFQFTAFLLRYPINAKYAILGTLHYPEKEIKKWHSLNAAAKYYGIYALDAHARLPVTEKIEFNFPSYKAMFEILTIYVKIDKELVKDPVDAAATIISAIKKGNFFNVIEAIAPANGFAAGFVQEDGEIVEIGGSARSHRGSIRLELPFRFKTDIIVRKDGEIFKRISSAPLQGYAANPTRFDKEKTTGDRSLKDLPGRGVIEIEVRQPGVYYVEVYVGKNRFNKLPWIMTNPFFINAGCPGAAPPYKEKKIALKKSLVDGKDFFTVETNAGSQGDIAYELSAEAEAVARFRFRLHKEPGKRDFWSCLACRRHFDFSGFSGLSFAAKSDKKMRYWLEIRTTDKEQETWYSHSFLAAAEWQRFYIPFDRFHLVYGARRKPDLAGVSSIFFSINNGLAYPGASGVLELKNIGLY